MADVANVQASEVDAQLAPLSLELPRVVTLVTDHSSVIEAILEQ
jgi:hypothetical protein